MGEAPRPAIVVLKPLPRLDRLVAVLPVAQARERGGVEILALAVERYTAGFVATFQAQSHGAVPFIDAAPTMTLAATDDRGNRYAPSPYGAAGEGGLGDWQWRLAYRFAPALDPRAAALTLAIAALRWVLPDVAREEHVEVAAVDGPWAFAIPFPRE